MPVEIPMPEATRMSAEIPMSVEETVPVTTAPEAEMWTSSGPTISCNSGKVVLEERLCYNDSASAESL